MEPLRVGLVGFGVMGGTHFQNYKKLEENGVPVKLVAICDVDEAKLKATETAAGNAVTAAAQKMDLSAYGLYTCMADMIAKENLDYVDLCLPTFLHAPMAIQAMEAGVHVFCEKPMAISSKACQDMIDAAKKTGKIMMIGHTLRYWPAYEFLKEIKEDGRFGKPICAYFYRGGTTPIWSWENWLLCKDRAGGALLDQHIHDVDTINWIFGMPAHVSSIGKNRFEGSGYDAVSTNYIYEDFAFNAQDDWTINGKGYGFEHSYRVSFEKGAVTFKGGKTTAHPDEGETYEPEATHDAYYKELVVFQDLIRNPQAFDYMALLESHRDTIRLAEAEIRSCDKNGEKVAV